MSALGDSFDPLGEHLQDPYPFYARARKEEPVFWSPRLKANVVTRFDDVHAILRDPDVFSSANAIRTLNPTPEPVLEEWVQNGYGLPPAAIYVDGELHRQIRAPQARHFAADRANAAVPFIQSWADSAVDKLIDDGHADLMASLFRPLPVAAVTYMYNLEELNPELVAAGTRGLLAIQGNLSTPVDEQVEDTRRYIHLCDVVRDVVERRRAEPRENDLVTSFLYQMVPQAAERDLTREEQELVVFNIAGILLPGHETTRGQLGLGMLHLLEHRDQWELLCERPELAGQAVEEMCRYDTSVPGMFRVATREVTVAGQVYPADTEFFLAYLSANRDEAFCDRADEFDITREPRKHLAFGYGAHYCLGAETGRRELRTAMATLIRRLPDLRLTGQPVEIDPIFVTRGPLELHVEW